MFFVFISYNNVLVWFYFHTEYVNVFEVRDDSYVCIKDAEMHSLFKVLLYYKVHIRCEVKRENYSTLNCQEMIWKVAEYLVSELFKS